MTKKTLSIMLLILIFELIWTSPLNPTLHQASGQTENQERTLNFAVQYGQIHSTHTLHLSIPNSMYEYYQSLTHAIIKDSDFAKYVTPSIFTSIAENIKKVTNNTPNPEEQFANAVLSLVRQIPYNKSKIKYPIETLIKNTGDCDVLSILAASIMKAGGLDVVLFHYKDINPTHVNIGVYLPNKPVYHTLWINPEGFKYHNKTYWIAETTPRSQWKVGDKPDLTKNTKPTIIPLENSTETAPDQISSSLDKPLLQSSISITPSPTDSNLTGTTRSITISGTISPALPNKTVTMYVKQGKTVKTYKTTTDQTGNYTFNWNLTTSTYQIQTSCTNIANYTAAESDTLTIFGSYNPNENGKNSFTSIYMPNYSNSLSHGINEFLSSNISGTGALLSGEFIVLSGYQTNTLYNPIIIPETEYHIRLQKGRDSSILRLVIPEQTIPPPTIPNEQLGFILQQNGDDNYKASIRILEDKYVTQITQPDEETTAFMNASQVTKENTWYKITAAISETATNATIYEENGTPLNNATRTSESTTTDQIGVLMAFQPGAIIAFRNLKVETLNFPEPQVGTTISFQNKSEMPENCILLITMSTAVIIVATTAIALVRKKRQTTRKQPLGT